MSIGFAGTGSALPRQIMSNDKLSQMVDTSDEWIVSRTGIRERRIAEPGLGLEELAVRAAKKALDAGGIKGQEVELIIVGTSTSGTSFPSCACQIQAEIGAFRAVCMDVSAACSGFLYALQVAHALMEVHAYGTALVLGADLMSRCLDWEDRSTCVLFGDGAGAVILKRQETGGIKSIVLGSDGTKGSCLICKPGLGGALQMQGQEVFRFAVKTVPASIVELLEKNHVSGKAIRYYILHQANVRILEAVARKLEEPLEKFPMNLDKYGNTSAASIPILLDELSREGRLQPGDLLVLAGFGAGLTWGVSLLQW